MKWKNYVNRTRIRPVSTVITGILIFSMLTVVDGPHAREESALLPHPAQVNGWTNMSPAVAPPPRRGFSMAYDTESDRIILFGGLCREPVCNATWAYDYNTNTWKKMKPAVSPSNDCIYNYVMIYHSKSDRIIYMDSCNKIWSYDYNNDTWTWVSMNSGGPLSGRDFRRYGFAYDSESDKIIFIIMHHSNSAVYETWAYDYNTNTWTNMSPSRGPPASPYPPIPMTYDSESDRIIAFVYYNRSNMYRWEVWTYDYNTNTWDHIGDLPAGDEYDFLMWGYDLLSDRVVLFGVSFPSYKPTTWTYDLNTNQLEKLNLNPHPSIRYAPQMAYDSESDRMILFGGVTEMADDLNDTWALELINAPRVVNTIPHDGETGVDVNTDIVIQFSEVMKKEETERAISISPFLSGIFTWSASRKIVTWNLSGDLQPHTNYTVTIDSTAISSAGMHLPKPYKFTFRTGSIPDTGPPFVVDTTPRDRAINVELSEKIIIRFSEPMDPVSTEKAISINSGGILSAEWSSDWEVVTLSVSLNEWRVYTVKISTEAKDVAGNAMVAEYVFSFETTKEKTLKTVVSLVIIAMVTVILLIAIQIMKKRKRCPKCGISLYTKVDRCPGCGYGFLRETGPQKPPDSFTKKRRKAIERIRKRRRAQHANTPK